MMKTGIKKMFLIIIIGIISGSMMSQPEYRFTLEDCLEYALKNSYNLQNIMLNEQAAASAYKFSKQERLPDLRASVNETFSNSKAHLTEMNGLYGLNTSITVFQGFTIHNTIKQNKLIKEQSRYLTSQYRNDLTIRILQAFLNTLGYEELIKHQDAVIHFSEEQLKQGEIQLQAGQITKSDYLLLKAQYAHDQNNIAEARINRDNSLLTLKNLLSLEPSADLEIIHPDTLAIEKMEAMPDRETVLAKAEGFLPELMISQYDVDIAKSNVTIAKGAVHPTISINAGIGTGYLESFSNFGRQLGDQVNEHVSLSVNIPIYNKGRTKSRITQNKIALSQAELNNLQMQLDVRQTVIQEYQNVTGAHGRYEAAQVKQNAYFQTFENYNALFIAGSVKPVDLLQQQNNYIYALYEYIHSKYGFMLKRKVLDVYMGEKIIL